MLRARDPEFIAPPALMLGEAHRRFSPPPSTSVAARRSSAGSSSRTRCRSPTSGRNSRPCPSRASAPAQSGRGARLVQRAEAVRGAERVHRGEHLAVQRPQVRLERPVAGAVACEDAAGGEDSEGGAEPECSRAVHPDSVAGISVERHGPFGANSRTGGPLQLLVSSRSAPAECPRCLFEANRSSRRRRCPTAASSPSASGSPRTPTSPAASWTRSCSSSGTRARRASRGGLDPPLGRRRRRRPERCCARSSRGSEAGSLEPTAGELEPLADSVPGQ